MKYRYKNTGTIVESSHVLDSAIFVPISDEAPKAEATKEPATEKAKKTTRKR